LNIEQIYFWSLLFFRIQPLLNNGETLKMEIE